MFEPPLLVLVGPTASGKTGVSLELADRLPAEIVGADSMQIYRGMDIGTDKVPAEVRARVRHHMIDVVDPTEPMDVARWLEGAEAAVDEIRARGRVPLVVGGTGLYIRSLLKGLFPGPSRDPLLRRRLRRLARDKGQRWLHEFLRRHDPDTADKVSPADVKRVVRSLEIALHTGRPRSALASEWEESDRYEAVKVGLRRDRADLVERIDLRVEEMYHHGLLDEVRRLRARGVSPEANAFRAIGYREALGVVEGRWELEEAIERTRRASRQYAKRQMTWFRREEGLRWVEADRPARETAREIERIYRRVARRTEETQR